MSGDQWRRTRKSDELFPGVNLWGAPQIIEAQLSSLSLRWVVTETQIYTRGSLFRALVLLLVILLTDTDTTQKNEIAE